MARKHKSPIKRARQDAKRHARNASYKSSIQTVVKKVLELAKAGEREKALSECRNAQAHLDKAETKGILQKNTVARKVSRIARAVAAMKA